MQDTSPYKDIGARYSDAELRKERHEVYDTIHSLLPVFVVSAGRSMVAELITLYQALRQAEREAEANPLSLPARNPVQGGALGLTDNKVLAGLIDHAHTVAAAVPRAKFGPWVRRVVEQYTDTIAPKLIRRLKLAMLDELAGKCDAEYTPLRRVLRRILEQEVYHNTWSLCAGEASLRDVYVHGGVRFTNTRVQRAFRALKPYDDGDDDNGGCLFDDCSSAVSHLDILDVHHCVSAVSNPPGGVQTVFINGLMYVQPLPAATGLRFPDPWMGGGQRADAVNAGFKEGLCALLLQLLAAGEQCGAWLGVFMMGGKFTRVVVLDDTTVALEVVNEPQQWLFDDPAWACANLPCYAFTCDEMWPIPNRITTVGAFFNSPVAQAPHFPNNLGVGWGVAGALEVNVNGDDEEEYGLQTLLDVFNVAALGIADTKRRPLWIPESTQGHRAAEILEKVEEYRATGTYTKFYPEEDEDEDEEHERKLALATMVQQIRHIRHTIPRLKRKCEEDSGPPAKRTREDSSLPAKRKREASPSPKPGPNPTAIAGDVIDIARWRETVAASADSPAAIPMPAARTPNDPAADSAPSLGEPEGTDDPSPEAVLRHLGVVLVLLNRGDMDTVIAQRAGVA